MTGFLFFWSFVLFCFVFVLFFESGFLCVALAVLELTLKTRLASNSDIHLLCLPSAGIKGVCHYLQALRKDLNRQTVPYHMCVSKAHK